MKTEPVEGQPGPAGPARPMTRFSRKSQLKRLREDEDGAILITDSEDEDAGCGRELETMRAEALQHEAAGGADVSTSAQQGHADQQGEQGHMPPARQRARKAAAPKRVRKPDRHSTGPAAAAAAAAATAAATAAAAAGPSSAKQGSAKQAGPQPNPATPFASVPQGASHPPPAPMRQQQQQQQGARGGSAGPGPSSSEQQQGGAGSKGARAAAARRAHSEVEKLLRSRKAGVEGQGALRGLRVDVMESLASMDNVLQTATPRIAAKDAPVFVDLASYACDVVRKEIQGASGRSPTEFVAAVRMAFGMVGAEAQVLNTEALASCASKFCKMAPGASNMLGPLEVERPKQHKRAERKQRGPPPPVVRPNEHVAAAEPAAQVQETSHIAEMMLGLLEGRQGRTAPLAELVCNHQSFGQTVENMFALTFLVRDARVSLSLDAQRGLMVLAQGDRPSPLPPSQQFVTAMTHELWQEMRACLQPAACIMPHRPPAARAPAAGAAQQR